MKKHLALLFSTFVFVSFFFASCEKDDDPTTTPKTKTELITQSNWKFKSAFVGTTDYSSNIQACQKDNIITFSSNGNGLADEGATKCNSGDLQTTPFTWNFQTSETILFVSNPLFTGGNNTFQLISISETELVVSQGFSSGPGPIVNVILTFNH